MKINRAAGQLVRTYVIIHFPPRVYGYVSAYCRPGDRPTICNQCNEAGEHNFISL